MEWWQIVNIDDSYKEKLEFIFSEYTLESFDILFRKCFEVFIDNLLSNRYKQLLKDKKIHQDYIEQGTPYVVGRPMR